MNILGETLKFPTKTGKWLELAVGRINVSLGNVASNKVKLLLQ